VASEIAAAGAAAASAPEAETPAAEAPAAAAPAAPPSDAAASPRPAVRKIEYKESKPVDLLDAAGTPVLKRALPAGVVLLVLLWLLRRWRSKA
jgi:hypothetical protein